MGTPLVAAAASMILESFSQPATWFCAFRAAPLLAKGACAPLEPCTKAFATARPTLGPVTCRCTNPTTICHTSASIMVLAAVGMLVAPRAARRMVMRPPRVLRLLTLFILTL